MRTTAWILVNQQEKIGTQSYSRGEQDELRDFKIILIQTCIFNKFNSKNWDESI